mgnify:FL=1
MKKKDNLSNQDKKDWKKFLEDSSRVENKDQNQPNYNTNKTFKFDLHGLTLDEANIKVREIIESCSNRGFQEILLITGKGLHSSQDDVYKSTKLSKLRYSVPEFINSDLEMSKLILSIDTASQKDGGEGALLIKLRRL